MITNAKTKSPVDIEAVLQASSRKLTPLQMLILAVVAVVYWSAIQGTEISLKDIVTGMPAIAELVGQMFPPDWKYLSELGSRVIETLQIGIIATIIASLLSLPLAFLAAKNVSPHPLVYLPVRLFLTICRGVSELIWALLFVVAVGLGPFAGVIALIIYCVGVIGKLLAEAVEAVDPGPLEAMEAAGASRWKVFLYGAWPQVLPLYFSYCLYYWDHNTRQAVVLGFVGAGGVGYALFFNLSTYYFEKAMMAMIVLILMIVIIDRFCLFLRQRII
ncbi:MAG: phosphonate ABC transporter, permease protein PhnE [Rhodospirillaceae bacterium]